MNEPLLSALAASPDVCVQKIDLARDAALLVQLSENVYRSASFLDDRILSTEIKGGWVGLRSVLSAADAIKQRKPLHFIFHTGHVGSTLLSRLLDESACVLSLREPLPLRTLADAYDVLELPQSLLNRRDFGIFEQALLSLWSRGYPHTHSVILKATSIACRIGVQLLEQCAGARAIYLNLTAEPYLATLLAGKNSAIDLRGHAPVRIRQLQARIATPLTPLHALSLGELAAMSWLVETWNQHDAVARLGDRVLALDFDDVLADVAGSIARVAAHFQLPREARWLENIARSPVLTRYSKSQDFEYSPQMRRELLLQSRQSNASQIDAGLRWLENLARSESAVASVLNASGATRTRA
jgi:predicted nucleic acid-binding protein